MKSEQSQRRRATRGAAALFLVAVLAACQPAGPAASPAPGGTFPALDRLTTTLQALIPGYTFDATVTIGGTVATHASGRWVSGSGEFLIEAQGGELLYRTIPPRAWVHADDSGWVELDSGSPLGNPIDALNKPLTLDIVGGQRGGLDVQATYPAAAFGLSGEPITVEFTLGADGSVVATYRAETPGGTAVSTTRMTPATNLEPVVAPSPGG
jgi:hypothetical protein